MSIFSDTVVDKDRISQTELNIANKNRSNPLKWKGQFSPQLVEVLLKNYSKIKDVILDPFAGSGTVLWEAAKRNNAVYGSEINPAAFILSNLYSFVNVPPKLRKKASTRIDVLLDDIFPFPLFAKSEFDKADADKLKRDLLRLLMCVDYPIEADLVHALVILLDLYQPNLSINKIFKTWRKIKDLVFGLPSSKSLVKAFHADARCIPLPNNSIDLVITSPPYINVINYHQQYRASAELMDWNLLEVAKSEIGSNRKNRGNRFLTVIQYCLDLAQCFAELQRVCSRDSRIIFVIGRLSTVRGIPFYNGEILSEVILRSFEASLDLRQERVFTNRFGRDIFEDILHFSFRGSEHIEEAQYLASARQVAENILASALDRSSGEANDGLKQALENLESVKPSPLLYALEYR